MTLRDLFDKADATGAQNAPLVIQHDMRANRLGLMSFDLILVHPAVIKPELHVIFLQIALTRLVAHGAIQRMVDEQEFQNPTHHLLHFLGIGVNHHPIGYSGIASRLQLGIFLNFHQAHPAGTGKAKTRVITIMRDLDLQLLGCLNNRGPFWNVDGLLIYRNCWHRNSILLCCDPLTVVNSWAARHHNAFRGCDTRILCGIFEENCAPASRLHPKARKSLSPSC